MHAAALELLQDHLQPGASAFDVGSGMSPSIYLASLSTHVKCMLVESLKGIADVTRPLQAWM